MEDVLEIYQRPYDARFPQICMDEGSKQVLAPLRQSLPMKPGKVEREDDQYERKGMYNIFVACEPLAGKRILQVRDQRTKKDWAHFMREVLEEHYPQAEKVILVMDNLNTHTVSSFYEAFPAAQARRLASRLEIHPTPTHGSWLNMAEIELSVLGRQCLSDRMSGKQELQERIAAWQEQRNQAQHTINWRFTTQDARIKLKRLYPSFEE